MNEQQEKEFIEQAFQTLKKRGWLPEPLEPTGITDQAIDAYEENKQIKIEASVTEFYCNCCGTSFYTQDWEVICPVCGCEYSEENNYIEKYG